MADEQKNMAKGLPVTLLVIGLALVTIGFANEGPLQIVMMLAAIGMLVYSVVLMRKNKKDSSTKT